MLNMKKIVLSTLVAVPFVVGSVSAVADDNHIERQMYQDKNYQSVITKARQTLEAKGYQVIEIEADDYRFQPALSVEAIKNGQEYDIKLSYPNLKVLKEKIDN